MTTSGSVNFSVNRNEIITEALELLGVIEPGVTLEANDITTCSRSLNMMIKAWQADGLNVFSVKRGYLYLEKNKNEYTLSETGDLYTYDPTKTSIDGAVVSGLNAVTLDSVEGFTDGDTIGVYQSDNTMLWTTGTAVGLVVTLADVLTADVDDEATVYFFSKDADAPADVIEIAYRNNSLNERPIDKISRKEWNDLSNKTYQGSPTQVFFDKRVSDPSLFVWPQVSDPRDLLVLWVKRLREDFDIATDTPDFPQRWYIPLSYNLAVLVGPKFGTPATSQNFKQIKEDALVWYERAQNYDSGPEANVEFQVDMGHNW